VRFHSYLLASGTSVLALLAAQGCSFPDYAFPSPATASGAGGGSGATVGAGSGGVPTAGSAGAPEGGTAGASNGGNAGASLGGDGGEGGEPVPVHVPKRCVDHAVKPKDCTCMDDDTHAYFFCAMTKPFTSAASLCSFYEMHLVKVESPTEDAWLLDHASMIGDPSVVQYFWIGASTIHSPSVWHWTDSSALWQGGANGNSVPGVYFNWRTDSPQNTATESCAYTAPQGWQDGDCIQNRPYACEAD
jgi:hypothetical protein